MFTTFRIYIVSDVSTRFPIHSKRKHIRQKLPLALGHVVIFLHGPLDNMLYLYFLCYLDNYICILLYLQYSTVNKRRTPLKYVSRIENPTKRDRCMMVYVRRQSDLKKKIPEIQNEYNLFRLVKSDLWGTFLTRLHVLPR